MARKPNGMPARAVGLGMIELMVAVPNKKPAARAIQIAGALLTLALGVGEAQADGNGGVTAAIGLTAADGSVRTQAGVRLSMGPVEGAPDRVMAMSGAVQARMPAVRECFSEAMRRASSTEGLTRFELESSGRVGARVKVVADETGDAALVSCMKQSLARSAFGSVPSGSRVLVGLYLSNPIAALHKRQADGAGPSVAMLAGGKAGSEGGTQAGEVHFRVQGSAYAADSIAALSRGVTTELAGLLDCRRKALRKERTSRADVALSLSVRDGALVEKRARGSSSKASECVTNWVERLQTTQLEDADLSLAISFGE